MSLGDVYMDLVNPLNKQREREFRGDQLSRLSYIQAVTRWEFPKNNLVKYDQSDESWCRFFGIGKEVVVRQEYVFAAAIVRANREEIVWQAVPFCE